MNGDYNQGNRISLKWRREMVRFRLFLLSCWLSSVTLTIPADFEISSSQIVSNQLVLELSGVSSTDTYTFASSSSLFSNSWNDLSVRLGLSNELSINLADAGFFVSARYSSLEDEDGDLILNRDEYAMGIDPEDSDTDDDSLPDGWEVQEELNAASSSGDDGASGDPDGDGIPNSAELSMGTSAQSNNTVVNLTGADVTAEYKSIEFVRSKVGYEEYTDASDPPKYYLKDEGSFHYENNTPNQSVPRSIDYNLSAHMEADSGSEDTQKIGNYVSLSGPSPTHCVTHDVSTNWDRSSYHSWGTNMITTQTHMEWSEMWDEEWYYWDCGMESHDEGTWHFECSGSFDLSDEYTTPELEVNALADLDSCQSFGEIEWGYGIYGSRPSSDDACTDTTASESSLRSLADNETSITLRKTAYRFLVTTETNVIYKLCWAELQTDSNGDPSVTATHSEYVMGSGGEQYIDDDYVLEPPAENGTIAVFIGPAFASPQEAVCWSEGGMYNAQNNLDFGDAASGEVTWSLTTDEGATATIDANGIVYFGDGYGTYTITASHPYNGCPMAMTLYALNLDIDVDADYDDDRDADDDSLEDSSGGLIVETRDTDFLNRTAVVLQDLSASGYSGNFRLTSGSSNVKLYTSLIGDSYLSFDDWMPVSLLPMTLWAQSDEPSATMRDMEITMELDDPSGCEDTIHLSSMRVDFTNSPSMKYGFDVETYYPYAWKTVKIGDSDTAIAEITPPNGADHVYFVPGTADVSVSPDNASASPETITITANAKTETTINADIGAPDFLSANSITVLGYNEISKRIALYHVVDFSGVASPTNSTTASTVQDFLNNFVYNQCVVSFEVTDLGFTNINYDTNGDGKLEHSVDDGTEASIIRANLPPPDGYDYVIYHVHDIDGVSGMSSFGVDYVFVCDNVTSFQRTIAHELGHAFGGLDDVVSPTHWLMYNIGGTDEQVFLPQPHWEAIAEAHSSER